MKIILVLFFCFCGLSCSNVETDATRSIVIDDQWELIWSDEFDYADADLEQNWISQNGPSGHILCSRWRENVLVSDGTLKLINKKEKRGGQEWTSGSIWTNQTFHYGYYECRYKYAAAEATNNSFWLMKASSLDGSNLEKFEIDINEGHYPNSLNTNIHDEKNNQSSKSFTYNNIDFSSEYHLFGLYWSEKELVFYLDNVEIRRVKNNFCFDPVPIRLSLAVITWSGVVSDAIDGTQMEVDYVRVYKKR